VDLLVSLGRPAVPSVIGMTESQARAVVASVDNLQVGSVGHAYDNIMPVGLVVAQNPTAGTHVPIGSLVDIALSLGRPIVPGVVGMHQSDAKTAILSVSLTVGVLTFEYSDLIPSNHVISQNPISGTVVLVGTPVELVVSLGKPWVPDLVGLSEAEARSLLPQLTLTVGTVTYQYNDTVPAGIVISHSPPAGTEVPVGSAVDLVVSLGKPAVPYVVGLTATDANLALAAVTLTVGTRVYEYNDTIPKDVVISQDPNAGTIVNVGSAVNLLVSLGRPIVPDVVGMTQADANAAIIAVDSLQVGQVTYEYHDTVPQGIVIRQDPNAGTAVLIGSSVDFVVSLGKPVVPNLIGMNNEDANDTLAAVTLQIGNVTYRFEPNTPPGIILEQNPPPGTVVNVGSAVDLVMSLAVVPDVVGLNKAQAYNLLAERGLVIGISTYEYSQTIPTATVISQSPAPGTRLPVGSAVNLHVSLGQPLFAILLGGWRLVDLQNTDGGWDWPFDDGDPNTGSDPDVWAPAVMGLAAAYDQMLEPNMLAALQKAKTYLLAKTGGFTLRDGVAAAALDSVIGGHDCAEYIRTNFFERLDAGDYNDAATGLTFDTDSYIQYIRDSRADQGIGNLAAWELGVGLYSAHIVGASTEKWIAAVKAEIDQLDSEAGYDVLGLAGAVLGLAAAGQDYDPQAGSHAHASNLHDLADILATYQLPTGGFTWQSLFRIQNFDESTLETTYAVMALSKVDKAAYTAPINDAANYFQLSQLPTNGWEAFLGFGEDNESTGEALRALCASLPQVGDFTGDGNTNFNDFAVFASTWLMTESDPNYKPECDISNPNDGLIDTRDLDVFAEHWLTSVR